MLRSPCLGIQMYMCTNPTPYKMPEYRMYFYYLTYVYIIFSFMQNHTNAEQYNNEQLIGCDA